MFQSNGLKFSVKDSSKEIIHDSCMIIRTIEITNHLQICFTSIESIEIIAEMVPAFEKRAMFIFR